MEYTGHRENIQSRPPLERAVLWNVSTTSTALSVEEASSGLRLELPPGFAGSKISVLEETPEGDYVPVYTGGELLEATVLAATAGFNALVPLAELVGLVNIKLVSDQTETCRGVLRGAA